MAKAPKFKVTVSKAANGEWKWNLKSGNGEIISSSETTKRRPKIARKIKRILNGEIAANCELVEEA